MQKLKYDMQEDALKITFGNTGTIVVSSCWKLANVVQQRKRSVVTCDLLFFLPEQLRVDEGDDILQDLKC